MRVTTKLFATLRRGRFDIDTFDLPEGATVDDIITKLGIPENEVTLIFVNGRRADRATQLADGDSVALFPPVGGG
ncbi:MAG: ThiS family protein [Syntrophorhabdus sp. PtaU1.Bin153]|nr:MAG: ThiS family protein [Syntrophorhabdus sp. PtaU1.Bin153]